MEDEMDEQNVQMMIEMADKTNKGYVNEKDFVILMKEIGLITEVQNLQIIERNNLRNSEAFEQAKIQLEMERKNAIERAELMKKKAAMGHTPAFNV